MLDLLIFSVFVLLMFLTPLLGIIKYEGLHGIIYRVVINFPIFLPQEIAMHYKQLTKDERY